MSTRFVRHSAAFTLVAFCLACASPAPQPPIARPLVETRFIYDDLDAFADAQAAIDAGGDVAAEMQAYIDRGSPGLQFFSGRFGATPDSMTRQFTRRPHYYRYLATLRPEIEAREGEVEAAIARLHATAPEGSLTVPVYFMIGNMSGGGNPGIVQTPDGPRPAIAVAIDVIAMSPRVDMSEFPDGPRGARLEDIPYVVLHETAHVFQMQLQGLDNYLSIYREPGRNTNLAFAVREGCADFLTHRASGWSLGGRDHYVAMHEAELWAVFQPIMHEPVDQAAGWFGPRTGAHPDWPLQVGYGLGMAICRTYYDDADDKQAALLAIYGAYLPEHFEAIAAPFAARLGR
jgi:predicted DNA-binding ribbon-helix-helix protein